MHGHTNIKNLKQLFTSIKGHSLKHCYNLRDLNPCCSQIWQLISILHQHDVPKLSRNFWFTFRSVQLPVANKALFQYRTQLCSRPGSTLFLSLIWTQLFDKKTLLLGECSFCHGNPQFNFTRTCCIIFYPKLLKHSKIFSCFLSIIICTGCLPRPPPTLSAN